MPLLEMLGRFWERTAPVLGIVLFLVRVLTLIFRRNSDISSSSRSWRSGRGGSGRGGGRFYPPSRPRYPKRWSINDIPRP